MRKVITNTTPIISLLKIESLEILRTIYGEIIVPRGVYEEIEQGKDKRYYQDLKTFSWITIKDIKNEGSRQRFLHLDKGEAEVIILAIELKADLVLIDELLGRQQAISLGLKCSGTIGVLLKAKELGFIESMTDTLHSLKSKGIWLSPNLVNKAINLANE